MKSASTFLYLSKFNIIIITKNLELAEISSLNYMNYICSIKYILHPNKSVISEREKEE